jgi:DNA-binding beta-propeller fold protein YncE
MNQRHEAESFSFTAALLVTLCGGLLAVASCDSAPAGLEAQEEVAFEVWAMDQGTNVIHIFDRDLEEIDRIDVEAHGGRVPHMIDFTAGGEYAFVANPASGNVMVIRGSDREFLSVLPTGPRTHAVTVAPDGRTALIAVIGSPNVPWDGKVIELEIDVTNERFTLGRELVIVEDPLFASRQSEFRETGGAVCMDFTADGRFAYVSLGPELEEGGLVVLDTESFSLAAVHSPAELPANCGTLRAPGGDHMFVNAGGREVGQWHALDAGSHTPVHHGDSGGHDAHGVWLTPDGNELWMVNRVTSNALIIDPHSFEELGRIDFVGKTPDIIAVSPDSRFAYVSLRGPNPVTMAHVAVGETPGFSVIDVRERRVVRTVEPAQGDERSDFHGIAVRVPGGQGR